MGDTTIEWCDKSWSPWFGCTKVHTGCKHCYAETDNKRWSRNGGGWGVGAPRKVRAEAGWKEPIRWARQAADEGKRITVFPSLCDVLDEEAPAAAQARFWDLIRATANVIVPDRANGPGCAKFGGLTWLLLTKRPERWEVIPEDVRPLVWLGTSVSDQETADALVPRLMKARGFAKRFLSVEPLVGPVDLRHLYGHVNFGDSVDLCVDSLGGWYGAAWQGRASKMPKPIAQLEGAPIDWVIVGGESGPGSRPCDVAWIRSIVEQCAAAGTPCFTKQLGAVAIGDGPDVDAVVLAQRGERPGAGCPGAPPGSWRLALKDPKGGDPSEWPADLRIREFPHA